MVMHLNAIPVIMEQENLKSIMDDLNSVTQCPYPVSLKKLEISLIKTDDTVLRVWVANFPCRASVLVQKVRDGLKFSTSALPILERLSRLETFRSIILEQEPNTLPILIHQALHSNIHVEQHLDICTNLLSYPLNELLLPDETEQFVSKICDSAVQHPSIRNIARLHRIVRGSCRELLATLPHQALHRLAERVIGIVKVTKATDEDSPILFCISILASLKQLYDGSSLESGILHHAADEFFHGTKCTKTIQLILLRAIWACKGSSATPDEGAVGCLRLAREILESIDSNTLITWRVDHAPIVRKLVEKISNCHPDSEVLCEGAALLNVILDSQDLPTSIVSNIGKSILSPTTFDTLDKAGYLTMKQFICNFIQLFDLDFCTLLLEKAFTSALELAVTDFHGSRYLLFLLQAFDENMQENGALASTIQTALSCSRLSSLLDNLLKEPMLQREAIDGHNEYFCLQAFYEFQRRLRLTIVSLSLKSSLLVKNEDSKLPASITQRLVHLQMKLCVPLKQCRKHFKCEDSNFISVPKSDKSDTYISNQGSDWKELLAADLKAKAAEQARQTIQTVERICRDFENRCDSIEEPLRKEEQKFREAQNSVRRLEDQVKTLGAEATDRILYLDGLEAEKTELEVRVKEMIDQNSSLTEQNVDLRCQLKEANDERSRKITAERSERDALDFQYKTRLTAKEVEIEKFELDLSASRLQNRELQARLDANETERWHLKEDIESLRTKLISSGEESKVLASRVSEKQNGLLSAENNVKQIEVELNAVCAQLEKANQQIEQVKSESSLSIGSFKTELASAFNLKKSIEDNLNRSRRQLCKLEDEHNSALIVIKDQETKIQSYEDTNDALIEELHVKENELAEGQELRTKLFALVGGKELDVPPFKPSEELLSRRALPTRTRSDAFVAQASNSRNLLQSCGSSGSSSRKSPTPKRMRKVFKVPTMKQPHFSPNKYPGRPKRVRQSDATRTPLSNASPGRYNITPHPVEPRSPSGTCEATKRPFPPIQTFKSPSTTLKPDKNAFVAELNDSEEQFEWHPSSTTSNTLNLLVSTRHDFLESDDTTMDC